MSISARRLRPFDVATLAIPYRRLARLELTARTWPVLDPDASALPRLSLASVGAGGRRGWLVRQKTSVIGFTIARPRAGSLVYDVEQLALSPAAEGAGPVLLDEVARYAGGRGARRVLLNLRPEPDAQDLARRAAFQKFTTSSVYRLLPGNFGDGFDGFPARPRQRGDTQGLFQLLRAAVPAPVRAAEAMTAEEWEGLRRFSRRRIGWAVPRKEYVWDLGPLLVAWMQITFGARSQCLEFLIHPRHETSVDHLVAYALERVSPRAPVYAVVRDYETALGSALERYGFHIHSTHDSYVRPLAARVPESRLMPASFVQA